MTERFETFVNNAMPRIGKIAGILRNYEIDGQRIGVDTSKEKIIEWLANFQRARFENYDLPLRLLESVNFYPSPDIYHKIVKDAKDILAEKNNYIAPLGEVTESSFKITANLHRNPNYRTSIVELLNTIEEDEDFGILFLDDFLNSGGQLISIFMALFGLRPVKGQTNDEIEKRQKLTKKQLSVLKKARLHFYYFLAYTEGIENANKFFESINVRAKIKSHLSTNENTGIFGDAEDQKNIAAGVGGQITHNSAFIGYTYDQLTDFYNLLNQIGTLLLKFNEPGWDDVKIKKRALGYGNLCQAIMTDCNIPTISLTAIWQDGGITYNGNNIKWNALLPRTKKIIYPKRSAVRYIKGYKSKRLKQLNVYLQKLYETDYNDLGLSEAKIGYPIYGNDFELLRHIFRFSLRLKRYKELKLFIKNLNFNSLSDGIKALIQYSLFECSLREVYETYPTDRKSREETIRKSKTHLDAIPSTYLEYSDTYYWLGRWYLELWYNQKNRNRNHLKNGCALFQTAILSKYKWYYHCYRCICLLLLEDAAAEGEIDIFYNEMARQRLINPDRPSVKTYSVTSFLLKEDRKGLTAYLRQITKPTSKTDFQNTMIHHLDMIFYKRSTLKKIYKNQLVNWLAKLPVR